MNVNELLFQDETRKVKLNYVVKNINAGISLNSVKYSDITEIMPVLLFYKHTFDCDSVPDSPTRALLIELYNTLVELKKNKSSLIPQNYHQDRYYSIFDNVAQDDVAMSKIAAGIKLYKFLVNHFEHDLVSISIVANETGYDTVADLNCNLTNNRIVPVSVKSYSSMSDAIKLKSVAWHRLAYNNTHKNVKYTLPEEYSITDTQDAIQASQKLLKKLADNLESYYTTRNANETTVDIFVRCILSKQETMVIEATTKETDDVIYLEEISPKNISSTTFTGCNFNGNVLIVSFGDMKFDVVVRFKNRYPTYDIYYSRPKIQNVQ